MSKDADLGRVLDCGIVAVVRSPDSQQLVEVARALADGGVTVVEITMTVPDALDVARQVRRALTAADSVFGGMVDYRRGRFVVTHCPA
jgi:2-dehydro-3-deoxyphosphogluconate aldolase / (4S)-4-hydroxy-2-oxoglutarate aldolase